MPNEKQEHTGQSDALAPGGNPLITDHSHGPVIMLAVESAVGWTYVDGSRPDSEAGAGIEVSRTDGHDVELTTPEEADALIEAIRVVRREVWG